MFAGKKKYLFLLFFLVIALLIWGAYVNQSPNKRVLEEPENNQEAGKREDIGEKEATPQALVGFGNEKTEDVLQTEEVYSTQIGVADDEPSPADAELEIDNDSQPAENNIVDEGSEETEDKQDSLDNQDEEGSSESEEGQLEEGNSKNAEDEILIQALEEPEITFAEWKERFHPYALVNGVEQEVLDITFNPLSLNQNVLDLIENQPEFSKPIWGYLDTAVSKQRVIKGRKLLARHHELLKRIEKKFGVQAEYIVAIWGLESGYGNNFGSDNVPRSLATLAYASERKEFYRKELIAALKIIQQGDIDAKRMVGSWAGAMGHTQFMPSTYENFAISFDDDGRRDLWHSLADVFASTANYLEKSGWQKDQTWGVEIKLPVDMDWELADPSTWLQVSEWGKIGITKIDGRPLNSLDKREARLFLPAGHKGPVFLSFRNFLAIKQYNNADSYALAVGYLGDRIRGGKEITAKWPRLDIPLSFSEKKHLQSLLSSLGYDTGGVDGKIGPNTRQALRRWQTDMKRPADGYVNESVLNFLKLASPY